MKDLHNNTQVLTAIAPAVLVADNTPPAVDLQGFEAAELVVSIGAGGITFSGTNKIEFKLTHGNDDSTYSAVTMDDLIGATSVGEGGIIRALTSAHASPSVTKIGYRGGKRFLKLLADFSGTHGTGTAISAIVVAGKPHLAPTN